MTADAVAVAVEVLTPVAPTASRFEENTLPRIRIDAAGGTEAIRGWHDGALLEVHCFDVDTASAAQLAADARSALTATHGAVGQAVVSKVRTAPPRSHDGDEHSPPVGHLSFPARVWLHPQP